MSDENKITLKRINDDEKDRWDKLVESSPHGTVFHTWDFVSAIAKHARMRILGKEVTPKFHPLIAENDGLDIGLIPLYEFRIGPFVYVFSPPPGVGVTYLGPCLSFPMDLKQSSWEKLHRSLHNEIDNYIRGLKAGTVRIRTPPGYDDPRPYFWLGYNVTPLFNYLLDIRPPLEELLGNIGKKSRKNLRLTQNKGYTIREGDFSDMEKLYSQQRDRYAEQGINMGLSLAYLKSLWERAHPDRLKLFVIEDDGGYVSSLLETTYKKKAVSWIGTTKDPNKLGDPNLLLSWETIKWAKNHGYTDYEILWANEERLNQFKTKVNPKISVYYSVSWYNILQSATHTLRCVVKPKKWGED